MKIIGIAMALPGVTQAQIALYIADEARVAWDLYAQGVIRENYTRTDRPGVVTVFECASVAEVEQVCQVFPLVQAGLIGFEFMPVGYFKPWAGNLTAQP